MNCFTYPIRLCLRTRFVCKLFFASDCCIQQPQVSDCNAVLVLCSALHMQHCIGGNEQEATNDVSISRGKQAKSSVMQQAYLPEAAVSPHVQPLSAIALMTKPFQWHHQFGISARSMSYKKCIPAEYNNTR